jgi:hypothetical protein
MKNAIIGSALAVSTVLAGCSSGSSSNSNHDSGAGDHPSTGGTGGGTGGTGGGGTGGGGGDAGPVGMVSFLFASGNEDFDVDMSPTTSPVNVGAPGSAPAGVTSMFDSTMGLPDAGSLVIDATFSDFNQVASVRHPYAPSINLSAKVIHANIRMEQASSVPDAAPPTALDVGSIYLFALSTGLPNPDGGPASLGFGQGTPLTLTQVQDGAMHELTLDLAHLVFQAGFDQSRVVQLGIQIGTGPSTGPAPSDGSPGGFSPPKSVRLRFDTVLSN